MSARRAAETRGRFQWVWWGWLSWRDWDVTLYRPGGGMARIYRWCVQVGPLELRRWD